MLSFWNQADDYFVKKILKSGKGRDWVKKNVLPYQLPNLKISYPPRRTGVQFSLPKASDTKLPT